MSMLVEVEVGWGPILGFDSWGVDCLWCGFHSKIFRYINFDTCHDPSLGTMRLSNLWAYKLAQCDDDLWKEILEVHGHFTELDLASTHREMFLWSRGAQSRIQSRNEATSNIKEKTLALIYNHILPVCHALNFRAQLLGNSTYKISNNQGMVSSITCSTKAQ